MHRYSSTSLDHDAIIDSQLQCKLTKNPPDAKPRNNTEIPQISLDRSDFSRTTGPTFSLQSSADPDAVR